MPRKRFHVVETVDTRPKFWIRLDYKKAVLMKNCDCSVETMQEAVRIVSEHAERLREKYGTPEKLTVGAFDLSPAPYSKLFPKVNFTPEPFIEE